MRYSLIQVIRDLIAEAIAICEDYEVLVDLYYYLREAAHHAAIARYARRGRSFERLAICGRHRAAAENHIECAEMLLRPFRLR